MRFQYGGKEYPDPEPSHVVLVCRSAVLSLVIVDNWKLTDSETKAVHTLHDRSNDHFNSTLAESASMPVKRRMALMSR